MVEPFEHSVIRSLGVDLAQLLVDKAFLQARLEAVRETMSELIARQTEMLSHLENPPPLPPGMAWVPSDLIGRLSVLLS